MSKLLRTTLKILAIVVVIVAVAIGALVYLLDPNQYRQVLTASVFDTTGLQLTVAGDVSLTYQPYVGITLDDVRLRNPARPQELASTSRVNLRVDPMALLSGRVVITELHAEDLHINWYTDANGNNQWMTERLAALPDNAAVSTDDSEADLQTRFAFVSVTDASIDLQNLEQGYYYSVRNLDFTSQNSNLASRPFPLQASFELVDPSAPVPWPLTLSTATRLDLASGEIELAGLQLAVTPALVEGDIAIENVFGDFSWQAQLRTSEFALDDLLSNLFTDSGEGAGTAPGLPGFAASPLWQTQLQASLNGDAGQVVLSSLSASLDAMALEMSGDVRFSNGLLPTNARFTARTNSLDLSPYQTDETEVLADEGAAAAFGPGSTDEQPLSLLALPLPDNLLSGINLQGSAAIDSLFVAGLQFGAINLFANVENGVLDLELQPTQLLQGRVDGNLRINSIPSPSQMDLELFASDLDVASLPLPVLVPGALSGRLNQESRFSGSGETVGDWLATANGGTSFLVTNSAVDIGIIKQVFTSIAVLSPRGETIQQWPDVVRLNDFLGFVTVTNGLADGQQVKLRMDNFDISGSGGIDLAAGSFDYDLLFTILGAPYLQSVPINPRYHNVSWPITCSAAFDDPVNRLCRPDLTQVREIFNRLTDNSLQYRLDEVITEQAPEALQNSSRGLLQNLYPDQPEAESDDPPPAVDPL